ncbi:uncharacterized protein LOC126315305 [Schistocerca gregaria]|uniref:uncharacterized protein LOC126315305 n=1 Tax=Schistocerca gregaria TaxID=7010 RepID=UPI00211EA8D5|nr:uncharacterized protein LOC126315305 [Schistocerca gregaria]
MRRVFYTGMTRAKRGVIFTHHRVSAHHGRPLRQSRFIPEALGIPSTIQAFRTVEKGVEDDSEQNVAGWTGAECASKIFGGGNFAVSRKPDSDIIANLHQLQVFLRCPLQFYHQFVISLPYRTMQLSIFQEAVSNVYTAFISGEVDQNCLSSVNKLRKIFNDCWTRHSVDPTEDPHIYESGMYIIDTLYEAEGDVELVRVNEPWKLDINLENSSPVQFNGYFQRIYNDGSIRQFIKYSESSPPEQGQLLLLANLLCYSYYVSHDKVLPTSVTIEYISSRYQLRTLRHVPDQNSIPEVANAITRITQKLSKAVYEAASNPKNCKKCPYNTNCPKSAN